MTDTLLIANRSFKSRLITGTGKHRSATEMREAVKASGCELVTVAIRRINFDNLQEKTVLDHLADSGCQILPNTAGCATAEEAVFTARLARNATGTNWIKLEVIPPGKYLLPDPIGTLEAARQLVDEGFTVLPYMTPDLVLARRLEEIGCATVMPLGSPIGSGRGILAYEEIAIIIDQANLPVVVDAGIGVPSDAAQVMEMGAAAVLVNTAIAQAHDPVTMAQAFKLGVEAGRKAFLAGRIPMLNGASSSSPTSGIPKTPS